MTTKRRCLEVLLLVSLSIVVGGCVLAGPTEKGLVHTYRLATDASLPRVQAEPNVPQWVKDSAKADHDALVAIDALMNNRAVTAEGK